MSSIDLAADLDLGSPIAMMLGNHIMLTHLFLYIPPYPDRQGFRDAQMDAYIALRTTCKEVHCRLFTKEDLAGFLHNLERLRLRNHGAVRVRPKRVRVCLDPPLILPWIEWWSLNQTSGRSIQWSIQV